MVDLDPWIVVVGEPPKTTIAVWQIAAGDELSIALFSSPARAEQYASQFCQPPCRALQFTQQQLIQLLADSYQQGTRYAALDPDGNSSRQLFVLRDVLVAARDLLKNSKNSLNN